MMSHDQILIKDLLVRGIVGVNDWERTHKQDILVNLALYADLQSAAKSDDVADSVNYRTVAKGVIELVESSTPYTVEALAERIAQLCLSMPKVDRVGVRVEKPGAVRFARSVGVQIERRHDRHA